MPYAVIDKGSNYFDTNLYTGNNTARNITLNFSPDFVWIRSRDTAGTNHFLQDSVRGTSKIIYSNLTNAETTFTDGYVSSFNSDGYSLTTDTTGYMNYNSRTYVGWSWRGSDSSAVSNTQGSITSTVSANTTSGFSIVSYTGNGTAGATVGHGLGVAPKMIIVKNRSSAGTEWITYHASIGNGKYLALQSTAGQAGTVTIWGTSSTTFTLAQAYSDYNGNGNNLIAYCFAEVKGFSKFGSYNGNGNADGTFVYTGFSPAWLMIKESSAAGAQWYMYDNKRSTYNLVNAILYPNLSNAEGSGLNQFDFYSNGFKARSSNTDTNNSGSTYIYACFASNPFVSSKGVAVTAR